MTGGADDADDLEIGVVARPHGLDGSVKVKLHNPDSAVLGDPTQLRLQRPSGERIGGLQVTGAVQGAPLMRVPDVADRDAAELLRGAKLFVPRGAVSVDDDEYLYADLIGCRVREGDRALGEVVDVFNAGASDVLVVRDGDHERMIPLVDDWVVAVDVDGRVIDVVDADNWEPSPAG